jgi:hypothetical protein
MKVGDLVLVSYCWNEEHGLVIRKPTEVADHFKVHLFESNIYVHRYPEDVKVISESR